jgi:ABC-type phosphate transport system substrate-binding protein
MNLLSTLRRCPAWAVLGAVGSSLLGIGIGIDAAADDTLPAVVINGQGDSDLIAELVSFQNALYEADQPTEMSYFNVGSAAGRRGLLTGKTDFILSGVPFTAAELAARAPGAGGIIDVPVSVAALAVVMTTPPQIGWQTLEVSSDPICDDPELYDPDLCDPKLGTFTGPFRVPADSLSAMIMGLEVTVTEDQASWANAEWKAALGTSAMSIQVGYRGHTWVNRSEAASQNVALLTYASAMSPDVWDARVAADPTYAWKPDGEQMSPKTKPTRQGTDQEAAAITFASVNPFNGNGWDAGVKWTGNAGAVPATFVPDLQEDFPNAGLRVMEIQNHLGQWVTPNRASIEAALAADPNGVAVGAEQDIDGAYPLVYLNHLYTVEGTLQPDEANSLAAFVRYLVTDGQDEVVSRGGAPLPAAQQAQALAAADEIVEANCTDAAYQVTTSGPGPFEPTTPKVQALTSMKHCTLVPAPATTTTTTTTTTVAETTTTTGSSTTTTTTDATTTTAETTTTVAATIVASQSPPASPSSGSGSVYVPSASPSVTLPPISSSDDSEVAEGEDTVEPAVDDSAAAPDDEAAGVAAQESTTTTATVAVDGATGGAGTRPRGVALSSLPMVMPDDGAADYKKLGTLFLGAALFLLGRRLISARRLVLS